MTKKERNRSSRRTTLVALGVSGVLHVAALLVIALPVPELSAPAERLALLPPLVEPVMVEIDATTPSVIATVQAPVADAGGAGLSGAADAAPKRPAPQTTTPEAANAPRPVAGEELTLAAMDSVTNADTAQPAAETAPVVVATLPAGESAGDGQAAQPTAPAARAHVPGSAAKAKGGGASAGSGGSSVSDGFGGITIKVGGGGRKKHPPRGMPGIGRW